MTNETRPSPADMYAASHQHPVNRALHAIGIPVIAYSIFAAVVGPRVAGAPRSAALVGVVAGSALLFLGHAIEGNRPVVLTRPSAVVDAVCWWARGVMKSASGSSEGRRSRRNRVS